MERGQEDLGINPASDTDSLLNSVQVERHDHLPEREIANRINNAFLEPIELFQKLDAPSCYVDNSASVTISEPTVLSALAALNPEGGRA